MINVLIALLLFVSTLPRPWAGEGCADADPFANIIEKANENKKELVVNVPADFVKNAREGVITVEIDLSSYNEKVISKKLREISKDKQLQTWGYTIESLERDGEKLRITLGVPEREISGGIVFDKKTGASLQMTFLPNQEEDTHQKVLVKLTTPEGEVIEAVVPSPTIEAIALKDDDFFKALAPIFISIIPMSTALVLVLEATGSDLAATLAGLPFILAGTYTSFRIMYKSMDNERALVHLANTADPSAVMPVSGRVFKKVIALLLPDLRKKFASFPAKKTKVSKRFGEN